MLIMKLRLLTNCYLTIEEKFAILRAEKIKSSVKNYLAMQLKKLQIEVLGDYEGNIIDLMNEEKLMGWCWQTTESAIVFLNDLDYIERGYLDFNYEKYYHSWICFVFDNVEYVFDPCLNILCRKKIYYKVFKPQIKGVVKARDVRNELIKQITAPKRLEKKDSVIRKRLENIIKAKGRKEEVVAHGPEDANTPLYRNGAGYRGIQINNNYIEKMIVHFYYIDC